MPTRNGDNHRQEFADNSDKDGNSDGSSSTKQGAASSSIISEVETRTFRSFNNRKPKRHWQRRELRNVINIISAKYGPCESLSTDAISAISSDTDDDSNVQRRQQIPFTRECAPFLRALLVQIRQSETGEGDDGAAYPKVFRYTQHHDHWEGVTFPSIVDGKPHAFVRLLGGGRGKLSMNAMFGDPCPGTSKRLHVHYTVTEIIDTNEDGTVVTESRRRTEVHHVSFAEHEPVKLRRCLQLAVLNLTDERSPNFGETSTNQSPKSAEPSMDEKSTVATNTQEVALPLVLPYLEVRERIKCSLISKCWRRIIQERGVATVIDANDPGTMGTGGRDTDGLRQQYLNRPVFRGLVAHSYTSLHSLFLSGFQQLEQDDLHPALPHLHNLNTLDITRCTNLDDSTLKLVAKYNSDTIRVLYLKGLFNVTDDGLKAVCFSCLQLEVLDVSQIMNITDESGTAIQHLTMLRALFLRDNYQLTNTSLDAITQHCVKLRQLTLWGLIGIRRLQFTDVNSGKITMLNLWGCHNLGNDLALALNSMSLSSLILSECHQLTDDFILAISTAPGLQNLQHLHLRYLKKLSDASLDAISKNFRRLYSLDLSFCSSVTATGIYRLLNQSRDNLVELRLKSIRNLDVAYSSRQNTNERNDRRDHTGHWILNALRPIVHSNVDHTLCVLDVRHCGGQPCIERPYDEKDLFVVGMSKLKFEQTVPGFFSRTPSVHVREFPS
ncbi:hypothetical protein IV203_013060 [Nitzschia inconspicua]|uniref:F-box/LRR-repeat protein 15-like leucin rich repeat domain-containing protein n=1 Tax=Nitzschia inconspicua TaxID=303405 RepID=A0A9K3M694_9STRA|nr:hypothetical protein IV203_013060 [Nitzschia inconspicua]